MPRGRRRGRSGPPQRSVELRRAMHQLSAMTLAQRVARDVHPRSVTANNVDALMNRISNPSVFIRPNRNMLLGLTSLGVFSGTMFRPAVYQAQILGRAVPFANPLSHESVAYLLWNEMHHGPRGGRQALFDASDNSLHIPLHDVYELPTTIFHYVLEMVHGQTTPGHTYTVYFALEPDNAVANRQERICTLVHTRNGSVRFATITDIFNRIMGAIHTIFTGYDPNDGARTWNGSEDSDTRIRLLNRGELNWRLKLFFHASHAVHGGGEWTEELERYISEKFPSRCYYTVKNVGDNECFLYMVALGMMMVNQEYWMLSESQVLEPATIRARGMFYSHSPTVQRISKMILEPSEDDKLEFPDLAMLKDSEQQISVGEFKELMLNLETAIFKEGEDHTMDNVGIDVYILDDGLSKHVYPVYMSRRCAGDGGRHVRLLCVGFKKQGHYLLITDMAAVMASSAGKIFYNCSQCNQAFFTRSGLMRHACDSNLSPDHYQWSRYDLDSNDDSGIVGTCSKCMLKFKTEFEYAFHKLHCFMEGRSGFRHVHCISAEDCNAEEAIPMLKGVEVDLEEAEAKNTQARLLYADFESTINPETGEHAMMSYGLYDVKTETFEIKYTLDEFVHRLYDIACEEPRIHVYFHNAMGYDANFILRYVMSNDWCKNWSIKTIMKSSSRLQKLRFQFTLTGEDIAVEEESEDDVGMENEERPNKRRKKKKKKYESHIIEIGDTFLFMTMSLEKIVSCLKKATIEENKQVFPAFFDEFHKAYDGITDGTISLILKKNIFPYRFFTENSRLDVGRDDFLEIFKPREENMQYFSETVTIHDLEEQYQTVERIFTDFNVQCARDYHDIYLRCDVMQLADVFTAAIHTLWESHHIFLPDYLGMPGASWAAFLRHDPSLSIPLYTNTIFAEFFHDMTRGGVTSAPLRHAVADETHSIIYLDVNGLYPYVMQAYKYPCGYFLWVNFGDDVQGDCNRYLMEDLFPDLERKGEGMCLTVDLHYTREVKDATDDYPFAPEHRLIYDEYFGEDQDFLRSWSIANNNEQMKPFRGLVGTLYDKTQYGVHWRLLKWYIEHGLVVTKIYWGVRFEEGEYLAGYVRKNIEIRNTRKDELGKMVYKLMGNSIYGKTFESPFKRGAFEIVCDEAKLQGMIEEGNISTIVPIDELGWVVKLDGEEIVLDKPTYIGACVVEYAKLHMYELYYDKLKKIFNDVRLVYTDTDSFIVRVEHEPALQDSKKLFAYMKEKCPGLLGGIGGQIKSETGEDDTIAEVIALRSKVYAYKTKEGHIGKRAKGTTKAAQEMQLDWEAYKKVLEELTSKSTDNIQFIRNRFSIRSVNMSRQSLSANDGKRNICADGIHTHAWGYTDEPEASA